MVSDNLINKWKNEGLINDKQARKMLDDIKEEKHDRTSKKLIVTFSTIGVLLVGLAAILFIGSNWQAMSSIAKFLILALSTVIVYFIGYYFKYLNKNYPNVGNSLIFLSSLLFGATVILTAQMYNWNANTHWLVLIWIIGIAPLVYIYANKPVTALLGILFLLWVGFFIFRGFDWGGMKLIPTYFVIGSLLMSFGALHYLLPKFGGVARIYRLLGLKVMMLSLFILTFKEVSSFSEYAIDRMADYPASITVSFIIFSVLSLVFMIYLLLSNPAKIKTNLVENGIAIALVLVTVAFFFFPTTGYIYVTIYNLIFAGLVVLLIYLGNTMKDEQILNLGMFYFGLFVIAKYFDFFYSMLETSLFMLIGGILLVGGGVVLEKKRRELKQEFKNE